MGHDFDVVTGVSGYTGKYIARRLLASGRFVKNLTGHPGRPTEFGERVEPIPFNFDQPEQLRESLRGMQTVYNTYWVRFPHGRMTFAGAVENTKRLMKAAKDAGVKRFVHVSIANPDENSPLAYYKGKGVLERYLRETGMPYSILRPTVIFGREDILINNIAWFLRRFPVFGVPGDGKYGIQPIFVEDMAELAIQSARSTTSEIIDAVGPEVFTFTEIVELIREKIGSQAKIMSVSPSVALLMTRFIGVFVDDVILTKEEIDGLIGNLLVSKSNPPGKTRFTKWLEENKQWLGTRYASEVKKHFR